MASETNSRPTLIRDFIPSKQISLFQSLKQAQFTGQLMLTNLQGKEWSFYIYLGRILYATGGEHPVRRWRRNILAYMPQLVVNTESLQQDLLATVDQGYKLCWEYDLLSLWSRQQRITREQVISMINALLIEVLFDITQSLNLHYHLKLDKSIASLTPITLIDAEQIIIEAGRHWQVWQGAKLQEYNPNSVPVIKKVDELKHRVSEGLFNNLTKLLNGKSTIRDLAVQMKKDQIQVIRSLLPYIQQKLLELDEIADLPAPELPKKFISTNNPAPVVVTKQKLIACIDDSPMICHSLEKILTPQGYQFIGINDPLGAMASLLTRKPDLIFLDLVMPNTNGYEICGQLRRTSLFKETPIIILTGNDTIVDRVRAKMVGCTDFISKPVESETILTILAKYLKQEEEIIKQV